jgi:hypothetical protein
MVPLRQVTSLEHHQAVDIETAKLAALILVRFPEEAPWKKPFGATRGTVPPLASEAGFMKWPRLDLFVVGRSSKNTAGYSSRATLSGIDLSYIDIVATVIPRSLRFNECRPWC